MGLTLCTAFVFAFAMQCSGTTPSVVGQLRDSLQKPSDDSRIMMRWWWFGPAVENTELAREIRAMN